MATTIESFLPLIKPFLPGCPESIMLDALRNAAIRFCTETWLTRETLAAIDVVAGTDEYTLSASSENEPVGLILFLYNEFELDPKTEEELDTFDPGWRTSDPGVATHVTSPDPDTAKLNRVPADAITGGIIARIATRPIDTATSVNDILYNDWRKAIKYGALEELYEIPKKQWSSMDLSLWYGKRFNFQIQLGKARARMGNMTKSTTAKMRAW